MEIVNQIEKTAVSEVQSNLTNNAPSVMSVIAEECEKKEQEGKPQHIGMFSIKSANQTMQDASMKEDAKALWKEHWYEEELCILFGMSGVGKSILAVQIAVDIANRFPERRVVYFDLELSEKQFERRNKNLQTNVCRRFPDNFYRCSFSNEVSEEDYADFENRVLTQIEQVAEMYGADIIIIDNITFLCTTLEKGDTAGKLVIRLNNIKKKHNWSMLILGHTPKDIARCPHQITKADLFGSSKIISFIDSSFAIGTSVQGKDIRYVVQVKTRADAENYGANNVINFQLVKTDAYAEFKYIGTGDEKEHLPQKESKDEKIAIVKEMHESGKSLREIESATGFSKSAVGRYIKQ